MTWVINSFGRDCFGNVTGYVVKNSEGYIVDQFVGDIYESGSHEKAKGGSTKICR